MLVFTFRPPLGIPEGNKTSATGQFANSSQDGISGVDILTKVHQPAIRQGQDETEAAIPILENSLGIVEGGENHGDGSIEEDRGTRAASDDGTLPTKTGHSGDAETVTVVFHALLTPTFNINPHQGDCRVVLRGEPPFSWSEEKQVAMRFVRWEDQKAYLKAYAVNFPNPNTFGKPSQKSCSF